MSRSTLLIAASAIVLAACQPAADAPQDIVAETPPVETEDTVATDVAETVTPEAEAVVEDLAPDAMPTEDTAMEADHDADHDHGDEDHSHDDGHDHSHDEDDHDHSHEGEHDHGDDHDHDHAGGEAHVHGLSELAASLEGDTLSVSIEGALANFDLDESLRTLEDSTPYTNGTVEIIGGDCAETTSDVSIRPINDHGNLMIDLTYTCGDASNIEAINVTGFANFAGFEEVNAVYLTDTGQVAETLTESDTRLDLN